MRILSKEVLGGAALLSAPALWQGFVTGSVSVDTAMTRWAITALLVWLALSTVAAMVGKPAKRGARPGTGQAQSADADTTAFSTSRGTSSPGAPSA